jgi:hypothetical protein
LRKGAVHSYCDDANSFGVEVSRKRVLRTS